MILTKEEKLFCVSQNENLFNCEYNLAKLKRNLNYSNQILYFSNSFSDI